MTLGQKIYLGTIALAIFIRLVTLIDAESFLVGVRMPYEMLRGFETDYADRD